MQCESRKVFCARAAQGVYFCTRPKRRGKQNAPLPSADAVRGKVVFCVWAAEGVYDCTWPKQRSSKARDWPQCADAGNFSSQQYIYLPVSGTEPFLYPNPPHHTAAASGWDGAVWVRICTDMYRCVRSCNWIYVVYQDKKHHLHIDWRAKYPFPHIHRKLLLTNFPYPSVPIRTHP